jgi:hypothetical protein
VPSVVDEQGDDVGLWLQQLLTDLRLTQAHYQSLTALGSAAQGGEWLIDYGDFVELAFDAHIAAVLLGVSRLLDRDRRATSLQWLVRVVRERPERFKLEPDEISTGCARGSRSEDSPGEEQAARAPRALGTGPHPGAT